MNPHQPYRLSAVPQTLQVRLEIANAIQTLMAPNEDAQARRRTEIAAIRSECEALKRSIQEASREWLALVSAELRSELEKYSPNQPRVPAGHSDGGQWTNNSETGTANDGAVVSARATARIGSESAPQYAALESDVRSDAINIYPGVQFAADPSRYAIDPTALTGISQIDETTNKLLNILVDSADRVGLLQVSPQIYGVAVHLEFAKSVIGANIHGIGPGDVEQRFSLPPGYNSTKKYVIPDVILRSDSGDILAIYDVKTGEPRLDPAREDELRAATKADRTVPVIILHSY